MLKIQLHSLVPYPASCLVRGQEGRPKSMQYGGVDRARVSSAAMKRAIRVSDTFAVEMEGHIGKRTSRTGEHVIDKVMATGNYDRAQVVKACHGLFKMPDPKDEGGKGKKAESNDDATAEGGVDDNVEESSGATKKSKPKTVPSVGIGKVKDAASQVLQTEQLAFLSSEEIERAADVVRQILSGKPKTQALFDTIILPTTEAVDIALFGRMFASRPEMRMSAAAQVAHPFTVSQALVETDYFVAVDDDQDESVSGSAFIGEQGFVSGLFYGYTSLDMNLLVRNLGGDVALAKAAARSYIKAALTVSPSGKQASFGSNAIATWAMIEVGSSPSRSLAGAFMRPVSGEDHHSEAVKRAEGLAANFASVYDEDFVTTTYNALEDRGSMRDILAVVDGLQA
jgi:CRISPR system Cascade subunit CasC